MEGSPHLLESCGGTATREQLELSTAIVEGFRDIGSGTVLVTHDFTLARRLERTGVTQSQRFTLDENKPTFQIEEGISDSSYAMRIAEKLGFTPDDVRELVQNKMRNGKPIKGSDQGN